MARLQFSNKAIEDLSNIWAYTVRQWSEQQADIYYQMLITSCNKIVKNPTLLGRKYNEIADGLLGFKASKHLIFYKITDVDNILIIRILHEQMDLKNRIDK